MGEAEANPAPSVGLDSSGRRREPWLRDRISRCFFGPIKRPPRNRDELADDVDYYPDAYLERLAREGVNGLWISAAWRDLVETTWTKRAPGAGKRLAKLRRTIEKCGRHGIRVWLFGIEPTVAPKDDPFFLANPEARGYCWSFGPWTNLCAYCMQTDAGRRYVVESLKDLFTQAPGLGGWINISHGEFPTTCISFNGLDCPRCSNTTKDVMHKALVDAMAEGVRAASPDAKVVSWLYMAGEEPERPEWIYKAAAEMPEGAVLMHNFESGGMMRQLGRWHAAGDYWLSFPGPGVPFQRLSDASRAAGRKLAAKIQVCNSHEMATVPYMPVPGLLHRRYKAMRECGVETALMCWYFGNAPGLMNRAAGELAHMDFSESEDEFLLRLAKAEWGEDAQTVAGLWRAHADAYEKHCPLSKNLQRFGPYHHGICWELLPKVELRGLEPTWLEGFPAAGDAIGECLKDFTLDETRVLAGRLAAAAPKTPHSLVEKYIANRARRLDLGVMEAVRLLYSAAANVFDFYRFRSEAIFSSRVLRDNVRAREQLAQMRRLVGEAASLSREMLPLCRDDSRLGFHSEAEGHRFFPARIEWRLDRLADAEREIDAIDAALARGEPYPESSAESDATSVRVGDLAWQEGEQGLRWRVREEADGSLVFEGRAPKDLLVALSHYDAALVRYVWPTPVERSGEEFSFKLESGTWGGDRRQRPAWVLFSTGRDVLWPKNRKAVGMTAAFVNRLGLPFEPHLCGRLVR